MSASRHVPQERGKTLLVLTKQSPCATPSLTQNAHELSSENFLQCTWHKFALNRPALRFEPPNTIELFHPTPLKS
jgi:hypothetical protein